MELNKYCSSFDLLDEGMYVSAEKTIMEKLPDGINNQSLFSDYYLSELFKDDDFFKKSINEAKKVFDKIKDTYLREKRFLTDGLKENETERRFIRPVLDILDHVYSLTPNVYSPEGTKQPDFAFFATEKDHEEAERRFKDKNEYFIKAISVGDAKRWNRSLDKKVKESNDPFTNQNPSYQIDFYLRATDKKWGILTNGKHWRLYNRDTSYRLDVFYEIDLQAILQADDYEAFLYFHTFFRKEAFTEGFLERAYKQSLEYTSRLGDELKENVYEALRLLAEGFLKFPGNNLTANDLDLVRENTFVLIYRILFILYAEARGLLPIDKSEYQTYSLRNLTKDISEKIDRSTPLSPTAPGYWAKLQDLCKMINEGDDNTKVPSYNGGLFDNDKHSFLTNYKVGDYYLGRAIDQLTRAEVSGRIGRGFISYRDMEIRHIGSIYEGLLEHRLKVTHEDVAVVKDNKGKEIFIPKSEVGNKRIIETYDKGEVFLETDKGERKATGSYYTPDYIVKYIVSNTLGPLLKEKKKTLSERAEFLRDRLKDPALGGAQKNAYKEELKNIESGAVYLEEILKTRILDPAMGSGHFLVEATDFLARELVKTLGESHHELQEDDIRWARREVVERCIFGVDLNPLAVELAKLSLWLYTVARNRPLSFLDHHLRCGNSLIGAWIKDLGNPPVVTKRKTKTQQLQAAGQITGFEYVFKQKINILLQSFELIEKLPSETVEQIKEKDKIYGEFRNLVRRFQEVADAWTSVYFGNEVPYENYDRLQEKLSASEEEWKNLRNEPWVKEALDIAKNKNFFHWELELPEIFFEGHQWKNNPGFDVVIGNPPYGTIIDKREVAFVREMFLSFEGNLENYGLFIERSIGFSLEGGRIGLIVPVTWCQIPQFSKLRSIVLTWSLDKLIELPTKVFGDSDLDTTVFILQKRRSSDDTETNVLSCQGSAAADADLHKKGQRVLKRDWLSAGGKLSFTHNTDVLGLLSKIQDISEPLGHLFDYSQGLVPYAREEMYRTMTKAEADRIVDEHDWHSNHRRDADFKRELRGDDIDRYIVNWNGKQWIKYGSWLARPREPRFFNEPRILIQEITRGTSLRAAFTAEEFYNNPGIINVVAKKTSNKDVEKPSLLFVLSLVNSSLFFSWHLCNSPKAKLVTSIPKILVEDVECFPIRRITFATSERDRKKQLEKGKTLYESCVKKGDDKRVTEFVEHHLSTKPERSDVVHDLLAFFAEQMIEMNKKKQKETKGFLSWLEGYSGAKIDDLTNKTKIKNYYELSWEDLLEVLEQNQRRIDKADISRRNPQEKIKKEFEDSLSKLNPLLSQIRTTDDLIDQIVYKLYGLTEKEINIVREQIKRV